MLLEFQETEAIQPILISSVLKGMQNGLVIQDAKTNPKSCFVLHDFGWAQLLGEPDKTFLQELSRTLFSNKNDLGLRRLGIFSSQPNSVFEAFCEKSYRCRLSIEKRLSTTLPNTQDFRVIEILPENGQYVSSKLGLDLFSRNWPNAQIFFEESFGCFIEHRGDPVAACYAAAKFKNSVEINVVTHEHFRNKGLGAWVTNAFLDQCKAKKLHASWDCFEDNYPSLLTAKKLGFNKISSSYNFYKYKPAL